MQKKNKEKQSKIIGASISNFSGSNFEEKTQISQDKCHYEINTSENKPKTSENWLDAVTGQTDEVGKILNSKIFPNRNKSDGKSHDINLEKIFANDEKKPLHSMLRADFNKRNVVLDTNYCKDIYISNNGTRQTKRFTHEKR